MTRTFGAPFGAAFGVNGPQSGLESRMSSLMMPLKSAGALGVASAAFLSWAKPSGRRSVATSQPMHAPTASAASMVRCDFRNMLSLPEGEEDLEQSAAQKSVPSSRRRAD